MRDADLEMIQTLTVIVVRTPLLIFALRRDERHMTGRELARAWWPATRDLSAVLIGSLALLVHSLKARRSLIGLARGLVYVVVAETATWLLLVGQELLLQRLFPGNR